MIADAAGRESRFETFPGSDPDESIDYGQHLYGDTSKIRDDLGYEEKVPIDDAARRTVEWDLARGN